MATNVPTGNTYDKYNSRNPVARKLMDNFHQNLQQCLAQCSPTRLLDVGTGEGELVGIYSKTFGDIPMAAIDLHDDALAANWTDKATSNMFASAEQLPFPDSSVDLVTCIEVLEHVPSPGIVLAEIARVASNKVVLSVPNEPIWRISNMMRGAYLSDLGNTTGHIQHWSRKSFAKQVSEHFNIIDNRAPFPWTMLVCEVRT